MSYKTVETYAEELTDDDIGVEVIPLGISASGKFFEFRYEYGITECIFRKKIYSDNKDIWIGEKGRYYYIRYSSVVSGEVMYDWGGK